MEPKVLSGFESIQNSPKASPSSLESTNLILICPHPQSKGTKGEHSMNLPQRELPQELDIVVQSLHFVGCQRWILNVGHLTGGNIVPNYSQTQ